jgi:hypothetical protein
MLGPREAGGGDTTVLLSRRVFAAWTEDLRQRNARRLPEPSARTPKEVACPGARDCGIIVTHNMGLAGEGSARYAATPATIDSEKLRSGAENSPGKDERSEFASDRTGERRTPKGEAGTADLPPVTD